MAVLCALFDGDREHLNIATGFCSGLARSGGPCGAMTGALLALGLVLGRDNPEHSVEQTYDAVRAMMAKFEAHLGSTNCTELLGVDLSTPEGRQAFEDRKLDSQCTAISPDLPPPWSKSSWRAPHGEGLGLSRDCRRISLADDDGDVRPLDLEVGNAVSEDIVVCRLASNTAQALVKPDRSFV